MSEKSQHLNTLEKEKSSKKLTNSGGFVQNLHNSIQELGLGKDDNNDLSDDDGEIDDGDDDEDDDEEETPYRDPPDGSVRLRPSLFENIPSTVFFEYPPELGIKRKDESVIEELGGRKLCYKSYWERICVKNAYLRAGFKKTEKNWTSLWAKHQNEKEMKSLNCLQKVNHFPSSWCIGRKDRLYRTLCFMRRIHGNVFDFHPDTYVLPGDRDALTRVIKLELSALKTPQAKKNPLNASMWIIKPPASSCGRGIKVINAHQCLNLPQKKKILVQKYLADPYLIDGKKFDLRIYVLVSGVDPMRVYVHSEGLTRISTAKYSLKNISNRYAHLTNYSINKKAAVFKAAAFTAQSSDEKSTSTETENETETDQNEKTETETESDSAKKDEAIDPEMEGFKWSLAAFRRWLAKKEGKKVMEDTMAKINDLCLKTMIAAESDMTPHVHHMAPYRNNCYELFGCDVILDKNLNPSLLEVNVSPSLMGSSPLDKKIKGIVMADIFHIVGFYPHDPELLRKYNKIPGSLRPSSPAVNTQGNSHASQKSNLIEKSVQNSSSKTSINLNDNPYVCNPFSFSTLAKLMNCQEAYRKNPSSETVDISALGKGDDSDSSWLMLLMAEDELQRAKNSNFTIVHPTPRKAAHYTSLYRSCRFSDHLLAHWVQHGGSRGSLGRFIPERYQKPKPGGRSVSPRGTPPFSKTGKPRVQSAQRMRNLSRGRELLPNGSIPTQPRANSLNRTRMKKPIEAGRGRQLFLQYNIENEETNIDSINTPELQQKLNQTSSDSSNHQQRYRSTSMPGKRNSISNSNKIENITENQLVPNTKNRINGDFIQGKLVKVPLQLKIASTSSATSSPVKPMGNTINQTSSSETKSKITRLVSSNDNTNFMRKGDSPVAKNSSIPSPQGIKEIKSASDRHQDFIRSVVEKRFKKVKNMGFNDNPLVSIHKKNKSGLKNNVINNSEIVGQTSKIVEPNSARVLRG